MSRYFGFAWAALAIASCGPATTDVTVHAVAVGSACHGYLQLQCQCCGSGQDFCLQYVDGIVADGDAVTSSTEQECAARKVQVTDVPAWCAATFPSPSTLRAACQSFPPDTEVTGSDTPSGE